ncbi:5685_t:CDS:2, partial [Racocetra persica]
ILPTPNENLINLRHNDDSSSVIENINQSLQKTKTNDSSGLFNNTINTKNSDAVVESNDYIFYKEVKYTIDEFLENMQKEINFLYKNNRELDDYLSHEHENIDEKDINYGRDYNIYGSVRFIDGVRADASHQNLCRNLFSFQIRAVYSNLVKS